VPRPRLLALLGAVVFVDAMLLGALAPLLPGFADRFDLSKSGAGALVGAHGAGLLAAALPAGLVSTRVGSRRMVVAGLALLGCACLAFAFANRPWELDVSRFAQGVAGAATWVGALTWIAAAAPAERRGRAIGAVFGAAVFGAIVGPLFGAAAAAVGIRALFSAVAAAALPLAALVARVEAPAPAPGSLSALRRALRDPVLVGALWLTTLPALLFSVLQLLAPLALARGGFGAGAIGLTFFAAGLVEVALNPLVGRLSDRVGRRRPLRLALVVSAATAAALAAVSAPAALVALVTVAGLGFGGLNTPGLALIADRAQAASLAQGLAFGAMVVTWGAGTLVGPAVGGLLAAASGDAVPYLAASAICLVTLAASYVVPRGATA
jgi:MFS family permease